MTIEVDYDPEAVDDGHRGCMQAMIKEMPSFFANGVTNDDAVIKLLNTAEKFGFSSDKKDYKIIVH